MSAYIRIVDGDLGGGRRGSALAAKAKADGAIAGRIPEKRGRREKRVSLSLCLSLALSSPSFFFALPFSAFSLPPSLGLSQSVLERRPNHPLAGGERAIRGERAEVHDDYDGRRERGPVSPPPPPPLFSPDGDETKVSGRRECLLGYGLGWLSCRVITIVRPTRQKF